MNRGHPRKGANVVNWFVKGAILLTILLVYVYIQYYVSITKAIASGQTGKGRWVFKPPSKALKAIKASNAEGQAPGAQAAAEEDEEQSTLLKSLESYKQMDDAEERCRLMQKAYHVTSTTYLEMMPLELQKHWKVNRCDQMYPEVSGEAATPQVENWRTKAQQDTSVSDGIFFDEKFAKGIRVSDAVEEVPDLIIKIMTYSRPKALDRMLKSLDAADYMGDTVRLEFWIDGLNKRASANGANNRKAVISMANNFNWRFGPKEVVVRETNLGLVGQWHNIWTEHDTSLGLRPAWLILEDDMELSPLFWRWLKLMWSHYRRRTDLAGISLQNQHLNAFDRSKRLSVKNGNEPFLYPLPGSWGYSPHPLVWPKYLKWQQMKQGTGFKPTDVKLHGRDVVTTVWYKEMSRNGGDPKMWTAWHISYMNSHGLFCLYSNLPRSLAFSASWNEVGEHDSGDMMGRRSTPLVMSWTAECDFAPKEPIRINFDNSVITSPAKPLRQRKCNLKDTNIIFDSFIYHLTNGRTDGGVAKMWLNIIPPMVKAVIANGGTFTNCEFADIVFDDATNEKCGFTKDRWFKTLPGKNKRFFSSYYQSVTDVCVVHMVYDQIPERTGLEVGPGSEYWPRVKHMQTAGGFLSISKSTTDDMCEIYGMCDGSKYVSTSDNRVSPEFHRASEDEVARFKSTLDSQKPYLLVVGKRYGYKNYGIFWEGIKSMPESFKKKYQVLLVGVPEEEDHGIETHALQFVQEEQMNALYTGAAAFVYTTKYEGFGMPPIEAAACGTTLILGPFHRDRMHQVFGDLALYATTGSEMKIALERVASGDVPSSEKLIQRSKLYGGDPKHGWNEVAKDYLEYLIHGPFRTYTEGGKECGQIVNDPDDCRFETTDDGIVLAA